MVSNKATAFLGDHPRLTSALLTACILLTSAGNVAASAAGGSSGS